MSHFTVLVIGENVEAKLAPYSENITVPRYVEYTKAQLIKRGKKKIKEYKNGTYAEYLKDKKAYIKNCTNKAHLRYLEEEFPLKLKWTNKEIYQEEIKYYEQGDIGKKGEVYSTYNPKSKWDWYEIGGRWTGCFKLKEGKQGEVGKPGIMTAKARIGFADSAKKGDIDFNYIDKDEILRLVNSWRENVIEKTGFYKPEYYLERYKTLGGFIDSNIRFYAHAIITEDGKWNEAGTMGWFGCSSETPEEAHKWELTFWDNFIKDLPDDTLLTLVDCHI